MAGFDSSQAPFRIAFLDAMIGGGGAAYLIAWDFSLTVTRYKLEVGSTASSAS
jgi:hypothetical protein